MGPADAAPLLEQRYTEQHGPGLFREGSFRRLPAHLLPLSQVAGRLSSNRQSSGAKNWCGSRHVEGRCLIGFSARGYNRVKGPSP